MAVGIGLCLTLCQLETAAVLLALNLGTGSGARRLCAGENETACSVQDLKVDVWTSMYLNI